jgi:hypothetical protein
MRAKFVNEAIKHLKPRSEEELQPYYDSLDEVTKKIKKLREKINKSGYDKENDFVGKLIWNALSIKDREYLIDKWEREWQMYVGHSNAKKRYENIHNNDLQNSIIGLEDEEYDD